MTKRLFVFSTWSPRAPPQTFHCPDLPSVSFHRLSSTSGKSTALFRAFIVISICSFFHLFILSTRIDSLSLSLSLSLSGRREKKPTRRGGVLLCHNFVHLSSSTQHNVWFLGWRQKLVGFVYLWSHTLKILNSRKLQTDEQMSSVINLSSVYCWHLLSHSSCPPDHSVGHWTDLNCWQRAKRKMVSAKILIIMQKKRRKKKMRPPQI